MILISLIAVKSPITPRSSLSISILKVTDLQSWHIGGEVISYHNDHSLFHKVKAFGGTLKVLG